MEHTNYYAALASTSTSPGSRKRIKNTGDPNTTDIPPSITTFSDGSSFTFTPFPKIEAPHRMKMEFNEEQLKTVNSHKWVVLEKVHGANFSFNCDGKAVVCSKRTGLLEEKENFFGHPPVLEKHRDRVLNIYKEAKKLFKSIQSIVIFGEIFGGLYPHPAIKDNGSRPVQREVYYSDKIDFIAFDVWVVAQDQSFWMDYEYAMMLFKKHDVFHLAPLFTGSLDECMKYPIYFNSTIPALLGLPPLDKNICEGIIVKSTIPCYVSNKQNRLIMKIKNAQFTEINPRVERPTPKPKEDTKAVLLDNLGRYFNNNRLMAVRSKIGEINKRKAAWAATLLYKDAMEEFKNDYEKQWASLSSEHQHEVNMEAKRKAVDCVQEWRQANRVNAV